MADENKIEVKISATTSDLKRGLDEAEQKAKTTAKEIENSGKDIEIQIETTGLKRQFDDLADRIKTKFQDVGQNISDSLTNGFSLVRGGFLLGIGQEVARGVAEAVGALPELVTQVGEAAKQIENQARIANATTIELQEWQFASSKVGVEQEKLGDIMKDVNDKLGDFMQTGGGEMADFFEKVAPKVGVTAKEFQGLSGPQVLGKYYDTLQKANVSHADMIFYMESIADDASLLSPLLENNGEMLKQYAEQAHNLGIIMDQETIAKTKEFNSALGLVQQTVQGTMNRMAAQVAPILTELANDFLTFATDNREAIDGSVQAIILTFQELLGIVQDIFNTIGDLWRDLTATTDSETIQQISILDILKGAFQALAIIVAAVRAAIQIAFALIRQIVVEALSIVIDQVIIAEKNFATFKANVQFYLDALSSALKTFANIAENALKLNFSGIQSAWEQGFNNLENLARQRANSIAKINQEAMAKSQANIAMRDEGRTNFKNTFFDSVSGINNMILGMGTKNSSSSSTVPQLAPNIRSSMGTGTTPSSGGAKSDGGKAKADAEARERKRLAEQAEKERLELEYKYADELKKIAIDLKKELDKINGSTLTQDQKREYVLKAEQAAEEKRLKLKQDSFDKQKKLEEQAIEESEKSAQRQYEIEMALLQAEFDAGGLSNLQKAQREQQLENQLYQIKRDGLLRRLDLEDQQTALTGKPAGQSGLNQQVSDLDNQRTIRDVQMPSLLNNAEMKDFEDKFGGFTNRISSLWDKGITAMMSGTLTWRNATNAVLTDMASFAIQIATQELQQWLKLQAIKLARKYGFIAAETTAEATGQAAQTGAVVVGEAARTTATGMGVVARLALKAGEAIKTIMMYAWEAMAGAFKAMVSIPYIGPVLAVGAGAAALGLVSGIAGKIKSARGGYDIPSGLNPVTQLHEEEMVLPAQHANTIRQLGQMMMNGSDGSTPAMAATPSMGDTYNIQAWDSRDIKRFMRKNGKAVASGLKSYGRNFGK
ncbi:MAG: phage tail protein [Acinetobacter populi]|uniref:phage tail protein n=1 Tax=Acinetobacter populi TaxID=1582270 RepID=UPI0023535CBB|nr:phage tail protein [Acinetobacter populi]MCH4247587.1 phage tail protein [Acinetobacter populi]